MLFILIIMKSKMFLLLVFGFQLSYAQFSNRIWCFGDSAGVDFTIPNSPTLFTSGMDCRGSCCSIADSAGLLFYAHTLNLYTSTTFLHGAVRNKLHQIMDNGDSLVGEGWYNEMVIVPDPSNFNQFWLFHIGVLLPYAGIFNSLVDITSNGGLGAVMSKNNQLQSFETFVGITAIKHGNGRDWWVLCKRSGNGNPNNQFCQYLVTPQGLQGPYFYNIGLLSGSDFGHFTFNHKGNKLALANASGLLELYNFDRCTGIISNPVTLQYPTPGNPPLFSGIEFSPNDSVMYVTTTTQTFYLYQYNMAAVNIAASKTTIATISTPEWSGGYLKLAPDGKIYWSIAWYDGVNFNYPYDSSAYNMYNMNLSVINNPNALGAACNFTPFSFYLGGKRTYYGLPNNPDYNLGPLVGSGCDTITHLTPSPSPQERGVLTAFYHSGWEKVFLNAEGVKGNTYRLQVVDAMGKIVYSSAGKTQPPYFTKDVGCAGWSSGIYVVVLQTEKEKLDVKFVKL